MVHEAGRKGYTYLFPLTSSVAPAHLLEATMYLLILVLLTSGHVHINASQEENVCTVFCPIVSEAPAIDGIVEEGEWDGSCAVSGRTAAAPGEPGVNLNA